MTKVTVTQDDGEIRTIGILDEDVLYLIKKKVHLHEKLNAWGIDTETFNSLCQKGLRGVVVNVTDVKKSFAADVSTIQDKGIPKHWIPYRPQLFIPLQYWKEVKYKPVKM